MFIKWISWKHCEIGKCLEIQMAYIAIIYDIFCWIISCSTRT